MPVNFLNLPGLDVVDFRETDTEYHVRATPKAISRLCSSCGPSGKVVIHQQKTLFVRDLPSHGRSVAIHLDVPRLKCHDCVRTFTAVVPEVDADRLSLTIDGPEGKVVEIHHLPSGKLIGSVVLVGK